MDLVAPGGPPEPLAASEQLEAADIAKQAFQSLVGLIGLFAVPADTEVALELALWDSVKDGSPAELESYLEQ